MNISTNFISLDIDSEKKFHKKTLYYFILTKFKIKLEVGID